ncbi:MAG: nonstructural protein [Microviridae sp.]|nr:MAG: nonstructural protein [Microviridae sp.]
MRLKIFVVRDRATDQFGTPMFLVSSGQAIRSFTDEVNRSDKDNQIFMHPDDFDLYLLGEYDSDTGMFDCKSPEQVCIGKNVKIRSN